MQLWFRVIFVSLWRFQAKVRNTDFLGSNSVKRHELRIWLELRKYWRDLSFIITLLFFSSFSSSAKPFIVYFVFLQFLDIYLIFCWWNFYYIFTCTTYKDWNVLFHIKQYVCKWHSVCYRKTLGESRFSHMKRRRTKKISTLWTFFRLYVLFWCCQLLKTVLIMH